MKKVTSILSKRILPALAAVLLLVVFSVSALAESNKTDRNTGKPDASTSQRGNADKDKDNGKEKHEEKVRNTYRGISVEKIALAIDSVTDEATKLELTALLEAYMTALENKDVALSAKDGSPSLAGDPLHKRSTTMAKKTATSAGTW